MQIKRILILLVIAIVFINCDNNLSNKADLDKIKDSTNIPMLGKAYAIKFSENISCQDEKGKEVKAGDSVNVGQRLVFTALVNEMLAGWSKDPSAWAFWRSNPYVDEDKKYTLDIIENSKGKKFTYIVNKDNSSHNNKADVDFIEITFLVKSDCNSISVPSPLGNKSLSGIDLNKGLPHEFFYGSSHNMAKKFISFINGQKGSIDWTQYNLIKEVIGTDDVDIDLSFLKKGTDLKVLYYGQKSRTDNTHYELKFLSKAGKQITDVFELELNGGLGDGYDKFSVKASVVQDENGNRYVCNKNDPDGRLYLIQGSKIYVLAIDGLHKEEILGDKHKKEIIEKIKKISKLEIKKGGLKEAFDLKDKHDKQSVIKKVKAVHDYLVDTIDYDFSPYCRSAYGALVQKKAVCAGYAIAYERLLRELNVDCKYITGTATGGFHAWNVVNLGIQDAKDKNGEKEWYQVDTTWNDVNPPYQVSTSKGQTIKDRRYKYFLKSTSFMTKNHHSDAVTNLGYLCNQDTYDRISVQNNWEWKKLPQTQN